jgi:hypothetical protein
MPENKIQYTVELVDRFSKNADQVEKSVKSLTKQTESVVSGFKMFGAALAGSAIIAGFENMISQAEESAVVTNQLNAVLNSTGNAVGMTAGQLTELANSVSSLSTFEDDAVLSAENVLLTFTQIGSTTFPQATQAIVDLSAAMGQDLQASAVQVGKALNSPIEGISSLSRVGVSFTDGQKDVIKSLVDTGDAAGAQTIILDELAKEFGGSAEAQLTPIGKMKKAIGEAGEQIGTAFLPAVYEASSALLGLGADSGTAFSWILNQLGSFVLDMVRGLEGFASACAAIIREAGILINGIARSVVLIGQKMINTVIAWIEDKVNTMSRVAAGLGMDDLAAKLTVNFGRIGDSAASFGDIWNDVSGWSVENAKMLGNSFVDIMGHQENLGASTKGAARTFQDYADSSGASGKQAEEAFKKLADAANDSMGKIDDALADTNANIAEIQKNIDALFTSRAEDNQKNQEKLANAFVKEYQDIEDLKTSIAEETDAKKRKLLQQELADAEAELAKHANVEQLYSAEISNAKEYASKSDFERAISDFQSETMLIEQKFQLEYQKLQEKLVNEQTTQTALLELKKQGEMMAAQFVLAGEKVTVDSVNRQIAAYNQLAEAVKNAKSGKTTGLAASGSAEAAKGLSKSFTIPAMADGGIVTRPTIAMVGEAGAEAIIPLNRSGGMGGGTVNNININWSGAVDERSAESVAKEIVKQLNLNLNYSML